MSRVLPILFNTDMVRAILDGRKTVTRRVVKAPVLLKVEPPTKVTLKNGVANFEWNTPNTAGGFEIKMPYQPGDILYVRETWSELSFGYAYKADGENIDHLGNVIKWRHSIYMPKEAARIWLKVKDVRVERLQEMTTDDCHKEGINIATSSVTDGETLKRNHDFSLEKFEALWDSTIKKSDIDRYGWDANPWVWVIEFERCEKPDTV